MNFMKLGGAFLCISLFVACGGNHAGHHHEEGEEHEHEHHHDGDHDDEDEHDHDHAHAHGAGNADEIEISPEKAKAAGIKSLKLQPADFAEVLEVSGRIENAQGGEETIVATASGIIKLNRVLTLGSVVEKGASLMSINTKAVADSSPYDQAKIAFDAAKAELERSQKLLDNQLMTQKDFNAVKERFDLAQLNYASVGKNYAGGNQVVHTSISGYVQRCLVKNGDYVEVGQPLAVISQNKRLYLHADVPEKYYSSLSLIRSANIKLPSGEVLSLDDMDGKLVSCGQSPCETYYLPVTFSFNSQGKTFAGSFVEVYLLGNNKPNTLSVPIKAIVEEQGLYFVFIQLDEECYRKQEVKLGENDGKNVEILSGLKSGDSVVVEGAYQVKLAGTSAAIPGHNHNH